MDPERSRNKLNKLIDGTLKSQAPKQPQQPQIVMMRMDEMNGWRLIWRLKEGLGGWEMIGGWLEDDWRLI